MKDELMPIEGFENYAASSNGDIISLHYGRNKTLSTAYHSNGYRMVSLYRGELKMKQCTVHRLIAKAFVDNPKNLPQVNHIDGNKANNKASNLEWATASKNNKHASAIGIKRKQSLVMNLETGTFYRSILEASRNYPIHYQTFLHKLTKDYVKNDTPYICV